VKTLHTWQCPHHGVLHTLTSDTSDTTDMNAAAVAIKATTSWYAQGCTESTPTSRGPRICGEAVTHLAGENL